MEKVKANEDRTLILMSIVMITTVPSILAIIILHVVKIVKLRNSPALQKDLQTINRVVSVILGIYVWYNLQKVFLVLNIAANVFQNVSTISVFVHHACNPYIYGAFSLWSRYRNTR
jgi:chromate transport protein ChrA